uniref:Uncharacterized protein n=1 Tax=Acrobeloides nanus TaxID=290746 RepID=A0A914D215_9BILA
MALNSKGFNASIDEILPLPMQMIRLNINPNVKSKVYVDNQWRSNQNQPNTMSFKLYTGSEEFFAAKREYRNIKITGSTMAKSSFFSKLENKYRKNGIVYLNSEDMNKLARDVAHTVYASDEVTANYIGTDQEDQLVNKIIDMLKEQKALANEIQKDEWNSVFWNDIFSRPDVQSDLYNQSFTYDQGKKHFIYNEAKDKQFRSSIQNKSHHDHQNSATSRVDTSFAAEASFLDFFSGSTNENEQVDKSSNNRQVNDKHYTNDTQTRDTKIISEDKMNSHLQQQGRTIRWTGEKFEPKALELYRINTRALKAKDEIAYQRVELTMKELSYDFCEVM